MSRRILASTIVLALCGAVTMIDIAAQGRGRGGGAPAGPPPEGDQER